MVCKKCGKENNEGFLFCIECGCKLEESNEVKSNLNVITNMQSGNNNGNSNALTNKSSKSSKKGLKVFIIGGIGILICLIILLCLVIGKSKSSKNSPFSDDGLIRIEKDEKYGYINTNGKFVIEPRYSSASEFYGKYAVVYEENNDGYEYVAHLIDKEGNVVLTVDRYATIKYNDEYDIWVIDNKLYNGSLKQITNDNIEVSYEGEGYLRWIDNTKKQGGIMNVSGKKLYTYNFKTKETYIGLDVSDNDDILKERYCRITVDNKKYAIVNCDTGKVVYDFTDYYISLEDNNIFEFSDKDSYNTQFYVYVQNDKIIYQTENADYELDDYYINRGYIEIEDEDSYKVISYIDVKEGKIVKEKPEYSSDESSSLSDWEIKSGLTEIKCNYNYGLKKGDKIVVACEWDDFEYLSIPVYEYLESKGKPYILGEKDSKTYLINVKNGKIDGEFNSTSVYDNGSSTFIYYTDKDTNKKIIYNLATNKSLVLEDYDDFDIYSNYITVEVGKKINYYNTNLKLIYSIEK